MSVNKHIALFIVLIFVFNVNAQRWKLTRYDFQSGLGINAPQNDIVGVKQYTLDNFFGLEEAFAFRNMGLNGVASMRYRITLKSSVKLSLEGGLMRGSDKYDSLTRPHPRKYNTFFFEPSVRYQYSLIPESEIGTRYSIMDYRGGIPARAKNKILSLYVFGGIGGLFFKPFVNDVIKNYGAEYSESLMKILVIPVGFGVKKPLSSRHSIGIEIGARYTLFKSSDFIDGIKPKASKTGDLYGNINVLWSYKLRTAKNGLPILFD